MQVKMAKWGPTETNFHRLLRGHWRTICCAHFGGKSQTKYWLFSGKKEDDDAHSRLRCCFALSDAQTQNWLNLLASSVEDFGIRRIVAVC